ncbi:MAG: Holliday junction resolvase RuvX [Candidatus Saccharimonadales bacterium]
MPPAHNSALGLDIGETRVGVAIASLTARFPRPLTTLIRGYDFMAELNKIIQTEAVELLVIGLPRGLDGQETNQTEKTKQFALEIADITKLPIIFQDEALTSKKAESELQQKGKVYNKVDIDALAATYILEDYLNEL